MQKDRLEKLYIPENCALKSVTSDGDIEIKGVLYVGDCSSTFEVGNVNCGGMLVADGVNAGVVNVTEHFLTRTANVEELNCGGDVEAEYLFCELGAYVNGDIRADVLISETHPVFCGGKFTGKFVGDPHLLHEHFSDWENLASYTKAK